MAESNLTPEGFIINAKLGSGSTADVYLAVDLKILRTVALRVPILHIHEDRTIQMQRFHRECRSLARLTSRPKTGIPALYMVGEHQGQPYSVREYVAGTTLEQKVAERSMAMRTLFAIIANVARIVDYVHSCGLVHRNLTAHNILVATDGVPWLIGFGKLGRRAGADPYAIGAGVAPDVDILNLQALLTWVGTSLGEPLPLGVHQLALARSVDTASAFAEELTSCLRS